MPWRKTWKGGTTGAPRNLRGTYYRGINVWLLVAAQMEGGYNSNVWLTFNQAKQRGLTINKGAKSTVVVFWKWLDIKEENDDGEVERKRIPFLRYYRVFNLDQTSNAGTEPVEVDDENAGDEVEPIEACEAIVAGYVDAPSIANDGGARAYYSPSLDEIHVPERSKFESAAAYYATLFHECGHSTGHASRLNRDGVTRAGIKFGDHKYSKEELVAEFTAAFLCGVAGIDCETVENSASYIDHWSKVLKNDKRLVVDAAQRAQKAADYIRGVAAAGSESESEAA